MKLENALVENIEANAGRGKGASRTFYTVVLGLSGTTYKVEWKSNPLPTVGEHVSCEVSDTINFGKYQLISRGASVGGPRGGSSPPVTGVPGNKPSVATGGFPIASDSHQQSIIRQNSLGHAVNLVDKNHAIFFGEGDITADEMIKRVVEVAFAFAEFSSGKLEVDVSASLAEKLRSV